MSDSLITVLKVVSVTLHFSISWYHHCLSLICSTCQSAAMYARSCM